MRIVIELTKTADTQIVLRDLYKRTPMQTTFGINLLALVDGEPRTLTLKQALRVYLDHRLTVVKRRGEFDLEKAKQRAHILEGYLVALKHLDEVISLIKNAPDVEQARTRLMKRFRLTELQANAILEMQLRRLAALERKKIETEYKEVTVLIKDLETLLKSPKRMRTVVAEELTKVKGAYGDRRRTEIVNLQKGGKSGRALTAADVASKKFVWIGVTADGLVARTPDDKAPRPSGHDAPRWLVKATTADTIYFVSKLGKAAAVAVQLLPQSEKLGEGAPYHRVSPLTDTDTLAAVFTLPARRADYPEGTCIITGTRFGMIKKTLISDLPGPSAQTFTLLKVNEGDVLVSTGLTDGKKKSILLASADGMVIRFTEDDVRPMGPVAAGVSGIKLEDRDEVIGMEILPSEGEIFLLTSDGKAKRLQHSEFPEQGRYGKGVRVWSLPAKVKLAGLGGGKPHHVGTIHLNKGAAKSTRLDAAAIRKRESAKGDAVVELKPGEEVVAFTLGWTVDRFVPKAAEAKKAAARKAAKARKKAPSRKSTTKKTARKSAPKKAARKK
jgi:DNA gyrase subunit A